MQSPVFLAAKCTTPRFEYHSMMDVKAKAQRSRACDRCHTMKEKCTTLGTQYSCLRCLTLDRACTRQRSVQRAGRKRRPLITLDLANQPPRSDRGTTADAEFVERNGATSCHVDSGIDAESLAPFEVELVALLQSERTEDLNVFVKHLVIGPNFEQAMGDEIRKATKWKFKGAMDSYLACMGALGLKFGIIEGGNVELNIRRGTLAVSKLRACPKPSLDDLGNWIIYGLAIVTFSMTTLGTGAATVRRYVLQHVASLSSIPPDLMASDSLICLVAFETWECLLKRLVPVLKLDLSKSNHVSRLFGVFSGLFSLQYEICELSHALTVADEAERERIFHALTDIELKVEKLAFTSQDFVSRYTTVEVVHMLCQAEVHKVATALFIHRLRYPFNSEDDTAKRLSRRIINEIVRCSLVTQERVRCVSFPFFVAAIETPEGEERDQILTLVERHIDPTTPHIQKQIRALLSAIWKIKDVSTGYFWLDLLPHLPAVTMPT